MKKPIALLLNDIHVDKDTTRDFEENWNEAVSLCSKMDIPNIFIGGDLFTSRASQTLQVLLEVKKALESACSTGIHITIAEGNHDKVNQESTIGYCHLYGIIDGVEVVDYYKTYTFGDVVLCIMSYFPEGGSFKNLLSELVENLGDNDSYRVLYIHEGIHGALGDFDIPGELPQDIFGDFDKVLVGHYHNRIRIKNTNIEYIGSSRQHNFGEDEEKGYTILYDDGSTKFIKNEVNVRYKTINVDFSDINDDFMKGISCMVSGEPPYKIRLRIQCSEAQSKLVKKDLLYDAGVSKIEFNIEKIDQSDSDSIDIDEKFDKNGIKKEYQQFCDSKCIDSSVGIKYLNMI